MFASTDNLRGAVYMMGAMAGFVLNDAMMKQVLAELQLFQAIFWRGLPMIAVLAVWCWRAGAFRWRPAPGDLRFVAQRTLGEIVATLTFLTALANMPLASATAILQSAPLVVTLAAALFLGEPLGWRRLLASLIGFAGVLMIVRPGAADFNSYALLAVAAVFMIALRDLSTRRLSQGLPSILVAFITSVSMTVMGAVGAGATVVEVPSRDLLVLIVTASGFLILGYLFSVMAMRVGEIGFVSPFRYTVLIWALLLDIFLFRVIPDPWTFAGSGVVVATGIFTFYRERRRARALSAHIPPR